MNAPANLKYAASHEWAKLEADGSVTIGITDHAQGALGDIVFLELPDGRPRGQGRRGMRRGRVGQGRLRHLLAGLGRSHRRQPAAVDAPESVNADAYANWLFRVKPSNPAELDALLSADAYAATL
jgi:glycine cleavage system H protein